MVKTEEGTHTVEDGQKLYTKTWKPDGEPRAVVVALHGYSDHCNFYFDLFPGLAAQGIEVRSFDQRGWGRSVTKPAEKGLSGSTARVLDDISSFLRTCLPPPVPLFLYGHSMGGAEILTYAAEGPTDIRMHIRGYLAQAPFINAHPSSRPSQLKVIAGRIAAKLLPRFQLENKLDPKWISRDPEVGKKYSEDPLCHDTGTLEGFAGILGRAEFLRTGAVVVKEGAGEGGKTRVWISHGSGDHICDFDTSKKLFEDLEVQDKEFKEYDGWYHALHAEPDAGTTFVGDVVAWINARLGPVGDSQSAEAKSKL